MLTQQVHIIGGGTFNYLASHFAVCAPAFGETPRTLKAMCERHFDNMDTILHLTKMAGGPSMVTNEDVAEQVRKLVRDDRTKIIFFCAAVVDYGALTNEKYGKRYSTRKHSYLDLRVHALPKIIPAIRQERKDIFLVAFKQTTNATEDEQYIEALTLCKSASANLVLANDTATNHNATRSR